MCALRSDLRHMDNQPNGVSIFNWVISTNIMLQRYSLLFDSLFHINLWLRELDVASLLSSLMKVYRLPIKLLASLTAESHFGNCEAKYRLYSDQIILTIRMWPSDYIPYNGPSIGCLLLGPAGIHLQVSMATRQAYDDSCGPSLEEELLKLAISQIERFWRFGSLFYGLAIPLQYTIFAS